MANKDRTVEIGIRISILRYTSESDGKKKWFGAVEGSTGNMSVVSGTTLVLRKEPKVTINSFDEEKREVTNGEMIQIMKRHIMLANIKMGRFANKKSVETILPVLNKGRAALLKRYGFELTTSLSSMPKAGDMALMERLVTKMARTRTSEKWFQDLSLLVRSVGLIYDMSTEKRLMQRMDAALSETSETWSEKKAATAKTLIGLSIKGMDGRITEDETRALLAERPEWRSDGSEKSFLGTLLRASAMSGVDIRKLGIDAKDIDPYPLFLNDMFQGNFEEARRNPLVSGANEGSPINAMLQECIMVFDMAVTKAGIEKEHYQDMIRDGLVIKQVSRLGEVMN